VSDFIHVSPSTDAYWRAIILFGRNSAAYKFALGKALLGLAREGHANVTLENVADPFARHVCEHLRHSDRQGTASRSRFLDACREHVRGELSGQDLLAATTRLGFVNVIDAFHVVGQDQVGMRFFEDARRSSKTLVLTDELLALGASREAMSLEREVEARWRLVETAWNIGIAPDLLEVGIDEATERLLVVGGDQQRGRVDVTSARDALNGYQKGCCFYCASPLSTEPESPLAADVDHFYPFVLDGVFGPSVNINGVWNLVLSCRDCNRGSGGKFDRIPALHYLEQLERRNNYLILSHHPLRETLMRQLGAGESERRSFLQGVDRCAVEARGIAASARWRTASRGPRII
jgi:hypothetical protein